MTKSSLYLSFVLHFYEFVEALQEKEGFLGVIYFLVGPRLGLRLYTF